MTYTAQSKNHYLDARVTGASQPELQLMMLEGALRFGRLARAAWDDVAQLGPVQPHLDRAAAIVEELVNSVAGGATQESKRLEEEYAFAYREIAAARLTGEVAKLDAALKLLDYQRETWRQACEKLKSRPTPPSAPTIDVADVLPSGFSVQA